PDRRSARSSAPRLTAVCARACWSAADVCYVRRSKTGMRGFVANTDFDWFTFLRTHEPPFDEVNFWKPGSKTRLSGLQPGEPLFFKLKAPHNAIGGFGYFSYSP